jgi:hypothetical protein
MPARKAQTKKISKQNVRADPCVCPTKIITMNLISSYESSSEKRNIKLPQLEEQ